jgi:DNA polymerase-3 subunit delta'
VSDDVLPWHGPQWAQVDAWLGSGRVPHAVLLSGAAGLGKVLFAERLARVLLCRPDPPDRVPCGKCQGCRLVAAGAHPDLARVAPEESSNVIKIGAVRDLVSLLGLRSGLAGRKVALIHPAEAMNRHAANALLKTLEEPAGDTVLILVSHTPGELPATVRSRCQRLVFRAPGADVGRAWLASRLAEGHDPAGLLQLAGGSPLTALALAESGAVAVHASVEEAIAGLMRGEADPVEVAEAWRTYGAAEICRWSYRIGGDVVRSMGNPSTGALKPSARRPKALDQAAVRLVFRVMDHCLDTRRALAQGTSVNEHLALDALASLWAQAAAAGSYAPKPTLSDAEDAP